MTLSTFRKNYVIYKSHNLKNDFISITYAIRFANSVSTERKVEIENHGGALHSLFYHETGILL